jgi:hypothetical protein
MNKISWRHHYIPKFYLKGFTNIEGKFKVFDVENQVFIKRGKDFYPESYFFEKDGNTVFSDEGADDYIETKYSKFDNTISDLFTKIRNSNADTRFDLLEDDMPMLQLFVSMMFWRIPKNYDQIKYLLNTKQLHELGIQLQSVDTGEKIRNEEFENRIKTNPIFFKMLKSYLPLITYKRLLDCRTPLTIQPFPKQIPALCSDNPVIFKKSFLPDLYYDDFIFPLTHTHVFIRGKKIREDAVTTLKFQIDLILLKQANKYVSCTEPKYIELLNRYYMDNFTSIDELKEFVFHKLIEI